MKEGVKEALRKLNALRNSCVHNVDRAIRDSDLQGIVKCLPGELGDVKVGGRSAMVLAAVLAAIVPMVHDVEYLDSEQFKRDVMERVRVRFEAEDLWMPGISGPGSETKKTDENREE
jgi:hypothetical protein